MSLTTVSDGDWRADCPLAALRALSGIYAQVSRGLRGLRVQLTATDLFRLAFTCLYEPDFTCSSCHSRAVYAVYAREFTAKRRVPARVYVPLRARLTLCARAQFTWITHGRLRQKRRVLARVCVSLTSPTFRAHAVGRAQFTWITRESLRAGGLDARTLPGRASQMVCDDHVLHSEPASDRQCSGHTCGDCCNKMSWIAPTVGR